MNKEIEGPIVVRSNRIEKMISSAQVAEAAFVGPQMIRDGIPLVGIKILYGNRRADQPHPTSAIGNSETTPILLSGQDSCARWKRRFARAGIRQKDNLFRIEIMRNP
jgi:hypothetical protein